MKAASFSESQIKSESQVKSHITQQRCSQPCLHHIREQIWAIKVFSKEFHSNPGTPFTREKKRERETHREWGMGLDEYMDDVKDRK